VLVAPLVMLVASIAPAARAQDLSAPPPAPPSRAVVVGRVTTPGPLREVGVPGVIVTVHRVGPDSSGPLDSVRTDASGRYRIGYARFGSDEALYFAAAVYHGIAYLSAPLRGERTEGNDAEITVFDTTSHPVRFTVQGHHIVVGAPKPDGGREIVEVYELSNDTTVTVVPKDTLASIWSVPLPAMATSFAGGPGDVAPAALSRRGDRVNLSASFGPGVKQLSYSYTLPERAFPLRIELPQTTVLEVLLEEPAAQVRGASLRSMGNATTQGRSFKRFLSQGTAAGEQIRIDVPTAAAASRTRVTAWVAAAILAAMAGALVIALRRRPWPRRAVAMRDASRAESLVAAIAALDARREVGDASLDEARYREQRASLKAQLAATLAGETAPT
jgi:hypothetical protein